MTIKIWNERYGFANNSSSTHSMIFVPHAGRFKNTTRDGEFFGWDFFTAATVDEKYRYMAAQLKKNVDQICKVPEVTQSILQTWMPNGDWTPRLEGDGEPTEIESRLGLDHQSVYGLPLNWEGNFVNKEYFFELLNYVISDHVVVLGGNDNDEGCHPYLEDGIKIDVGIERDQPNNCVAIKKDDYWLFYNRTTGEKKRFSFGDPATLVKPTRSSTPELVDLSITDYCTFGCRYCYRGSTEQGVHADASVIRRYLYALEEMRVPEVVFGGGETSQHPDFLNILQTARYCKLVPNFTTRDFSWLEDEEKREKIMKLAGSFAFSVSSMAALERLVPYAREYNTWKTWRVTAHIVLGTVSMETLETMLRFCGENNIRVTLLGYKTTGRGAEHQPHVINYSEWLNVVQKVVAENSNLPLGIDTPLAKEFEQQLLEAGIPSTLFHTTEGAFSCFIDAVKEKMFSSSYSETEEGVYIGRGTDLKEAYSQLEVV